MTVYIVVLQRDKGIIAGVFSTMEKASQYISDNPYNGYALYERTIDQPEG